MSKIGCLENRETSAVFRLTLPRPPGRTKLSASVPGANDLVWKPPCGARAGWQADQAKRDAMGAWLHTLAPWLWFGTFTFDRLVSANGARYWFNRYLDWLASASGRPPQAFRADEYGARNGRLHLHALIAGVSLGALFEPGSLPAYCGARLPPGKKGRTCCATHALGCGYARVFPFDRDKGASFYVSKYVLKANGDWDLFGF